MSSNFNGLFWLLLSLGPFLILQRKLHKEIQSVFLILFKRVDISLVIFSILFLPGVVLHEMSHYLFAIILRVRTGRFSIFPQNLGNGRVRLGFVETEKTDFVRGAVIGMAPLISGGAIVGLVGLRKIQILYLWDFIISSDFHSFLLAIRQLLIRPDFWLWFYIITVVSSTMLPSKTDRRSLFPLILTFGLIFIGLLFAGFGSGMVGRIRKPLNDFLLSTAIVFTVSASTHTLILLPIYTLRRILSRVTGYRVGVVG